MTPLINNKDINSPSKFISNYIGNCGIEQFIMIIETKKRLMLPINEVLDPEEVIINTLTWLKQLHVSINTYLWILTNKLLPIDTLFQGFNQINHAIIYFVTEISKETKSIDCDHIRNKKLIIQLQGDIVIDILEWLNCCLQEPRKEHCDNIVNHKLFSKFLVRVVFESHSFVQNKINDSQFKTKSIQLLNLLYRFLDGNTKAYFLGMLQQQSDAVNISDGFVEMRDKNTLSQIYLDHLTG